MSDMGHQFYVTESLTLFRKNLLSEVRNHLHDWKYIWTRDGNIWARRSDKSQAEEINTYRSLDKVLAAEREYEREVVNSQ